MLNNYTDTTQQLTCVLNNDQYLHAINSNNEFHHLRI